MTEQLEEDIDNKELLVGLFNAMYDELPVPRQKSRQISIMVS